MGSGANFLMVFRSNYMYGSIVISFRDMTTVRMTDDGNHCISGP